MKISKMCVEILEKVEKKNFNIIEIIHFDAFD